MRTRRTSNIVGAVLAGALMAAASPAVADAQSPQSSDPTTVARADIQSAAAVTYRLKNVNSQSFLQSSGGSSANGAKIVQQESTSQRWAIVPDGDWVSFWRPDPVNMNLGIDRASGAAGAAAIQANPSGDANQDWKMRWKSDTQFELFNRKSEKCLGISGASQANGAQAAQFECDGKQNQLWAFTN
ncbi:RICIN domain-containing protein [Streptomyces hirsutus]|uniref:RICIN domain-containing protein n=1 Tax=Streptomyces hirsutus TaxID=35620 RepID=A0ABZ1H1D5_9ACTN|nr:RICIN domain-containing protein [Streptomyces hirsutus]WSD04318.1 RICIN domain-containing protein [Streptomyces hirsutus]WSD11185.1 RICIN domain-containing protein [Streptomyces hirsutus]